MHMTTSLKNKGVVFFICVTCTILLTFGYYNEDFLRRCNAGVFNAETIQDLTFLVYSNNCRMPDLDPFNEDAKKYFSRQKYKSCTRLELLTYVSKEGNTSTLHINRKVAPSYSKRGINCCYSNVARKADASHPDKDISVSKCQTFKDNVTLHEHPVTVKCQNNRFKQVYENAHQAVVITEDVQKKLKSYDNTTRQAVGLLFVGIDSISRLNLIRALPNTYKYLEGNDWLTLRGYNKMDDNTFPNLMAIFTGMDSNTAYKTCEPTNVGKLDECKIIWKEFSRLGYVTAYGEDEASISTFNYNKVGFKYPPTDYYFRPYVMATEKLKPEYKDHLRYCTGPETAGERIMSLAKDFAVTFKNYPYFGFFWMNSFSHSEINTPSAFDDKILKLFTDLESSGVMEKSIVIFLSDHGIRFGNIRLTNTGWLEERLPFIYLSFPKWFRIKFSKEINNFKTNLNRLTCPYDVHMTLQQILQMSGYNRSIVPSEACPRCKSLFEEVDPERSCQDAGITPHWCTCYGYAKANFPSYLEEKISSYIVQQIHDSIRSRKHEHKCAKYVVDKIIGMRVAQKSPTRNETLVLVQLQLKPKAIVESTVSFDNDLESQNIFLTGDISRLDSYLDVSTCVKDAYLKKYCYCRSSGERL